MAVTNFSDVMKIAKITPETEITGYHVETFADGAQVLTVWKGRGVESQEDLALSMVKYEEILKAIKSFNPAMTGLETSRAILQNVYDIINKQDE